MIDATHERAIELLRPATDVVELSVTDGFGLHLMEKQRTGNAESPRRQSIRANFENTDSPRASRLSLGYEGSKSYREEEPARPVYQNLQGNFSPQQRDSPPAEQARHTYKNVDPEESVFQPSSTSRVSASNGTYGQTQDSDDDNDGTTSARNGSPLKSSQPNIAALAKSYQEESETDRGDWRSRADADIARVEAQKVSRLKSQYEATGISYTAPAAPVSVDDYYI